MKKPPSLPALNRLATEPAAGESDVAEPAPAEPAQVSLDENQCVLCHGTEELWDAKTKHLFVRRRSGQ